MDGPINSAEAEAQRGQLVAFAAACEVEEDPVAVVRGLAALLAKMAPKLGYLHLTPEARRIEQWLAVGAAESAAMAIAEPDIGYLVSRSPAGAAVASAWIPDRSEELTVYGSHPAVALCGAIALVCAQALAGGPAPGSAALN